MHISSTDNHCIECFQRPPHLIFLSSQPPQHRQRLRNLSPLRLDNIQKLFWRSRVNIWLFVGIHRFQLVKGKFDFFASISATATGWLLKLTLMRST